MDVKELVNILVVEVLIFYSVYRHQVLYNCISHRESWLNVFTTVLVIGHLESELTLPIDAACCRLIILVEHAKGMVLPVKLLKEMETIICLYEIHVGLEEISAMDAELILFTMMDYRGMVLIRRC